jgi:NSS family neurotransmitter:Na+ symporter
MFVTLPLAFGQMTGGVVFGAAFFLLVTFAAITSAISLVEPALAWLVERFEISRIAGAVIVCGVGWVLGLGSAFSFNIWSDVTLLPGMSFFDTMDYVSNNIMLPLGGIVIALFAGWILDKKICREELDLTDGQFKVWEILVRVVSPAAVGLVFVMTFT